jgi:hypothetical protein
MPLLTKDSKESQKALSKLVAKTWLDEAFKERFISEPVTVLEENGLTLPSNVEVRVNENTLGEMQTSTSASPNTNVVYEIPLPHKPAGLTEQQIQSWVHGDDHDTPVVTF